MVIMSFSSSRIENGEDLFEEIFKIENESEGVVTEHYNTDDDPESDEEEKKSVHQLLKKTFILLRASNVSALNDDIISQIIQSTVEEEDSLDKISNFFNYKDPKGQNALMILASRGFLKSIQIIIDNCGELNEQDNNGKTALMHAAENQHLECIRSLINTQGIHIHSTSLENKTAFDYLVDSMIQCLQLFDEKGHSKNNEYLDHYFKRSYQLLKLFHIKECFFEDKAEELIKILESYKRCIYARYCLTLLSPTRYQHLIPNSIFKFRQNHTLHFHILPELKVNR